MSSQMLVRPGGQTPVFWMREPAYLYLCLAVSDDGVTFRKESYDVVPGTNVVITIPFDGAAVWLDETVPAGSPERCVPPSRNLPRAC